MSALGAHSGWRMPTLIHLPPASYPPPAPHCCCSGFGSTPFYEPFVGLLGLVIFYNVLGYSLLRFTKPKYLPLTLAKKAS